MTTHREAFPQKLHTTVWLILCCLLCLTTAARAQIAVGVSDQYQVIDQHNLTIPGNTMVPLQLSIGELQEGDVVWLAMKSSSGSAAFVVDLIPSEDYRGYVEARQKLFNNVDRGRALPTAVVRRWDVKQRGDHLIMLTGEWTWGTEEVQLETKVLRKLNSQEQALLGNWIGSVTKMVDSMFIVSPFRVDIQLCGYLNARSYSDTGNIMLCTELLHRLGLSNGQFIGFVFHEFGHTLLKRWGLPGWDQEDTADDFAVYMLLQFDDGIGMAADFASAFQSITDPKEEANRVLTQGGRHSTSLQRYQNIQQRLRGPRVFMEEWNRLLYPHMQTQYLRRIVSDPRPFESQHMAAEILSGRR